MPVIGLDHILIAIPQGAEPQAIRFYCGLLGFLKIEKPNELAGRGGAWLRAGDFILHLGTEKDVVPPKRAHPGLLVDDLAAMIDRLRAESVELTFDVPLPGYDRVHIRDPFGNRIELLQRLCRNGAASILSRRHCEGGRPSHHRENENAADHPVSGVRNLMPTN